MKFSTKIFASFFVILLYCFAIKAEGKAFEKIQDANFKYFESSAKQQVFAIEVPTSYTIQVESLANGFASVFYPTLNTFCSFSGILNKKLESLFCAAIKQYQNCFLNILVTHRKTDIIFPFHYFW